MAIPNLPVVPVLYGFDRCGLDTCHCKIFCNQVTLGVAVAEYLGFLHTASPYLHLLFIVPTIGL